MNSDDIWILLLKTLREGAFLIWWVTEFYKWESYIHWSDRRDLGKGIVYSYSLYCSVFMRGKRGIDLIFVSTNCLAPLIVIKGGLILFFLRGLDVKMWGVKERMCVCVCVGWCLVWASLKRGKTARYITYKLQYEFSYILKLQYFSVFF